MRVDEIWVASTFVRDAFRGIARKPVTIVPPAVEVGSPSGFDATRFRIRPDAVVYFFNFDALSTAARKNPWGVIDAFSRAFTPEERDQQVQLVIKVHNLERAPAMAEPLRDAVSSVDGILVNAELPRSDMDGLLDRTDVYVSLHRSEGFGLGLAEAMYLGKPVIATAYSGNMDFTRPGDSCLVGYSMQRVTEGDHRHYPPATNATTGRASSGRIPTSRSRRAGCACSTNDLTCDARSVTGPRPRSAATTPPRTRSKR